MFKINENYLKLPGSYLFSTVGRKEREYKSAHPDKKVIKLSIGDVTQPIAPTIIKAMHAAVDEMGNAATFHGYAPDLGYEFLRKAIADGDYKTRGVDIAIDEIFVSDGAKCDSSNIQEILGLDNRIAVGDPVYPVYVDSNVMAGRAGDYNSTTGTWSNVIYMPCKEENGFMPQLPEEKVDIIYLCFPNNPIGVAATREQLKPWVEYAKKNDAVILYDSAYEAFITDPDVPHSIYEIEGAKEVAIEFRSFSKTAGFTGTRCAYTVVPHELKVDGVELNGLWNRRQCTKFNGVPYVIQRAAEAVYTDEGYKQTREAVAYYLENAKIIRESLTEAGFTVYGGVNAPYIWAKTPNGMKSWDFFDKLLEETGVVTTPGSGFGPSGEGYVRFTAFSTKENTIKAMEKIKAIL